MSIPGSVSGLWCAMLSPVDASGKIERDLFVDHAKWLLDHAVQGLSPFGTTGEGPSFSLDERRKGLEMLLAAGIPAARLVAATGCASLPETIELTRHAVKAGCRGCLVLPPFFWKDASDEGLFAWHSRLIEAVGSEFQLYLYHLPQVSGTPLSPDLVARLAAAFPEVVVGIKDSSGDWSNTEALLQRVPQLAILVGHEPYLPRLMRRGGAGSICGVANLYPQLVAALLSADVTADDEQRIATLLDIAFRQPFLPAFKAVIARRTGDPRWRNMRLPLVPLEHESESRLMRALTEAGLDPGIETR